MGELVDVNRDGAIARVVMHRKGNNSIAEDLMAELAVAFEELGQDPSVRVVVLASEYEKYFSVGADLASIGGIARRQPLHQPDDPAHGEGGGGGGLVRSLCGPSGLPGRGRRAVWQAGESSDFCHRDDQGRDPPRRGPSPRRGTRDRVPELRPRSVE